ncbi:MAG: sugar ABC transporter substrate-binding protein [Firmicutes bacterium]|nr:sugar ABC transporter substrate-binding protein [Bacillota bacterium]
MNKILKREVCFTLLRFKRLVVLSTVLLLALGVLAGPVLAAQTKLTVLSWGSTDEINNRKAQVAAFEKAFPHIKVDIQVLPTDEYDRKLDATWAAGTAADVIMMSDDWHGNRARRGVFSDLGPYIERDNLDLDSILTPGIAKGYKLPDGMRHGLPISGSSMVIAYNKDMFDQAGLTYPNPDWTWDDLKDYAVKLTDGTGINKTYGIADHWGVASLAPHIFGGRMFNEDETEVLADDPKVVRGIEYFMDLMKKYEVMPDVNAAQGMPSVQRFFSEKAAMIMLPTWDVPSFQESIANRFAWDTVIMPADPDTGQHMTLLWTTGYAMNSQSKVKDEAWEFIKFVSTSNEASEIASEVALPSVLEVAETTFIEAARAGWVPINMQAFVDSFAFGTINPLGGYFAKVNDEYNRAWDAINLDRTDAETGMKEFSEKAAVILEELK